MKDTRLTIFAITISIAFIIVILTGSVRQGRRTADEKALIIYARSIGMTQCVENGGSPVYNANGIYISCNK